MYQFHWPTKTILGRGVISEITDHLPSPPSGASVMIAGHQDPWAEPLANQIAASLQTHGWSQVIHFLEVEPNPSWKTVQSGAQRAGEAEVELVVAVGGGSVMDAAKVIAERSGVDFLCTVPTTAGTGGEISPWAVISNTETREKDSLTAKWPDLTLLDPELTRTLPPQATLFTGIDAFIHGLEAYLSSAANPLTDALALQGMQLIQEHLQRAIQSGQDLDARQGMLEGSLLTGAAMLHAGLGLMHAIGNVTGGLYHQLPHGLILMRCLDAVLDYNQPVTGEKYQRIRPMVEDVRDLAHQQFQELSVPEITIQTSDLVLLAERAAANVNAETNPRPATPEDIQQIVRTAFHVQ